MVRRKSVSRKATSRKSASRKSVSPIRSDEYRIRKNAAERAKRMNDLMSKPAIDVTEIEDVVNVYKAACAEHAKWDALRKDLNKTIKALMKDAEIATVRGVPALRLSSFSVARFDGERFREDYPELHAEYTTSASRQTLTVVKNDPAPNLV